MFNSGFKESQANVAEFPEDDPMAFDIFLTWVYSGNVPQSILPKRNKGNCYNWMWPAYEVYGLADKLCLPQLME